jgi:hypothetical protein
MYKTYLAHTDKLDQNIVSVCCSCISHDMEFKIVLHFYGPLSRPVRVSEDVDVSFKLSCGIDLLD